MIKTCKLYNIWNLKLNDLLTATHILSILILFVVNMWLAFAAKSAESNNIAFFASYLCKKADCKKKKYFAQYVSKHGGGMQNFYDCI